MIKAIVYTSNTGFTKKYAQLLSEQINVPCYELKDCSPSLGSVIFMGWLSAGKIKGYAKCAGCCDIKAVVAVGMSAETGDQISGLAEGNKVDAPLFYLRGGVDFSKLRGLSKLIMKIVYKSMSKKDPELEVGKGADFVKPENLAQIVNWYNNLSEA